MNFTTFPLQAKGSGSDSDTAAGDVATARVYKVNAAFVFHAYATQLAGCSADVQPCNPADCSNGRSMRR